MLTWIDTRELNWGNSWKEFTTFYLQEGASFLLPNISFHCLPLKSCVFMLIWAAGSWWGLSGGYCPSPRWAWHTGQEDFRGTTQNWPRLGGICAFCSGSLASVPSVQALQSHLPVRQDLAQMLFHVAISHLPPQPVTLPSLKSLCAVFPKFFCEGVNRCSLKVMLAKRVWKIPAYQSRSPLESLGAC